MNTMLDMTNEIGIWLSAELDEVSSVMSGHLQNKHPEVNSVCSKLAAYKGKMLRPSLLLLSWRATADCAVVPKNVVTAAAVVELIHLATLVHDDILDEADIRRGAQTINSLCGNEAAVILGDYLLSSAFHLCSTIKHVELNILLGEVTNTLCAGELVQLSHRNDVDLSLDSYFQIINDKTASLIAASCEMGSLLGGGDGGIVSVLRNFGGSVGKAFQIRDDLLDLLAQKIDIGKPAGRDLEKGKLTLPVIAMLAKNPDLKPAVLRAISNHDRDALRKLLLDNGSISSALHEIKKLVDGAVAGVRGEISNDSSEQLCNLAAQLKQGI
ncbi:MAG: polyprenyl synthetase family protein [Planctomycetes bacterium]|nr:polyprenyl synthetase family protein [Planctomycetota bacterium]